MPYPRRGIALSAVAAAFFTAGVVAVGRTEEGDAGVAPDRCFACHGEVRDLWASGKHTHAGLPCSTCHTGLARHAASPTTARPGTNLAPENCGACHVDQFRSFFETNWDRPARVEKSQPAERSPNPAWDKLMMGHGFTAEHNAPRSHAYMLLDHLLVDRAYGGRFQPREGWLYTAETGPVDLWNVIEDAHPETTAHRPFLPGTAAAANPTCLTCKTSDMILGWRFGGDTHPRARWWRGSNVVEVAKDLRNVVGCVHCHDPHATAPRIVRDGLIQALERPARDTLWHRDERRTPIRVVEFRDFRKVAILDRYDARLQCGQCHVEYNCNPGYDSATGAPIRFDDPRTNHFPFKPVAEIYDHYNQLGFRDFRHTLTGGLLFKAQHPEAEVFYGSRHDRAGVNCNDCHMPVMTNAAGETYTSHWQTSPRHYIRETCLRCHTEWDETRALYAIDSVRNHIRGKMRKAEFWLGVLIDKIVAAREAGLDTAVIAQAQEQHQRAHILWEWWTAENSDGFHDPAEARESLTLSVVESKKGIEIIDRALAARRAGR